MTEDKQEQRGIRKFDVRFTNCLADWSLGLGIVMLFLAVICAPMITGITWPQSKGTQWSAFSQLLLFGLPAIILGALAIARRGQSRSGMRRAVAGVILGMLPVVMALGHIDDCHEHERRIGHSNNLHMLALAAEIYCDEHQGRFPPAARWNDALRPYFTLGPLRDLLHGEPPLAMNRRLSGVRRKDVRKPDQTVLFFDSAAGRNLNGGPELIAEQTEFGDAMVVLADGGVQKAKAAPVRWNP